MIESKTQLAKLLATEDITVRHSATAKTASFDVKQRVLTLPNWVVYDADVLDLMQGHEVGHALWTLMSDWENAMVSRSHTDYQYHKGILNIVEDARIEKKIKRQYPGLVKSFISGYRSLQNKEFFHPKDADVSAFNMVDRINLHFKMGPLAAIPFNKEESVFVTMTDSCESWDDVLKTCRAIQEYMAEQMESMEESSNGHSDMLSSSNSEDSTHSPDDSDDNDSDDNEDFDGSSDSEGQKDSTEDYGGYGDDDFDWDDEFGQDLPEDLVSTQESFDNMLDKLVPDSARGNEIRYFSSPEPNLKNIIVSYKDVIKELTRICKRNEKHMAEEGRSINGFRTVPDGKGHYRRIECDMNKDFVEFKRNSMKIVGYMAKEFERKKSASEYRKESVAKTGVLDVNKLHQYKYEDDLFLRNTIRPDGKNHGVVMLLDWSASMSGHLFDTMKQVMNMVWFCQKVNIPYEVYAFSNSYQRPWDTEVETAADLLGQKEKIKEMGPCWKYTDGDAAFGSVENFRDSNLLNIFSSRMNAKDSIRAQKLMWRRCQNERYEHWSTFDLSSTPLLDGLCAMKKVIPNFQERYKLDITNLIVLTDGQGNSSFSSIIGVEGYGSSLRMGRHHDCRMEDPLTKKVYKLNDMFASHERHYGYGAETTVQERAILSLLKDRYGINIVGIFLDGDSNRISQRTLDGFLGRKYFNPEAHKKARAEIRKDGVAGLTSVGYNEFYIMPVGKLREEASELEIDETWTASKMKNAFKKNQSKKFGNKVLVNRMMDIIA